jgi:hypothetical protein
MEERTYTIHDVKGILIIYDRYITRRGKLSLSQASEILSEMKRYPEVFEDEISYLELQLKGASWSECV